MSRLALVIALTLLLPLGTGSADLDRDRIPDTSDNCPEDFNPAQEDLDHDGIGDVCDPDATRSRAGGADVLAALVGAPCGDLNGDEVVDELDVMLFRDFLADPNGSPLSPEGQSQCTVIGEASDCDILDVVVLRRALAIPPRAPGIAPVCAAAVGSPPLADAGPDQLVLLGEVVQLDGSESSDADGDPLSYGWTFLALPSGSAASLSDPNAVSPSFTPDLQGGYTLSLVVSDGNEASAPDLVEIFVDVDSDGDLTPDSQDCAPQDSQIHPDAPELCGDGIDNNCSGVPDDLDADNDSFIAAACGGDDADDDDPNVNPAVAEVCDDGIDNNGNGLTDAADAGCFVGCDLDGDGHASSECGGDDVDDSNPAVYPGAPESCADFIDNDQDGEVDEGCDPGEIRFGPQDIQMVAGDQRTLSVTLDGIVQNATAWMYEVDDVVGGTASLGQIAGNPVQPAQATYAAPDVAETSVFTLDATDPNDPARTASTLVTVHPSVGSFVVTPASPTLGLSLGRSFSAGLDVPGVGVIPLRKVVWQVNGLPGGGIDRRDPNHPVALGRIGVDGFYRAPRLMPEPIPFALSVGFSLALGQLPLGETDVTLAELTTTPKVITSLSTGLADTISGERRTSDGVIVPLAGSEMDCASSDGNIAMTDPNCGVLIGADLGQASILVADRLTGARDTVAVHSRPTIILRVEVISTDPARIVGSTDNVISIEYTCPGASFEVRANVLRLRGSQFALPMTGRMRGLVTMEADDVMIKGFVPPEPVPQPTGFVAVLREDTGVVTMGDQPGSGVITLRYDDGFVMVEKSLTVIYTRPEITVESEGRVSGSNEPFLTEDVEVNVRATNPSSSSFLGELPLRITLLDGSNQPEPMDVVYADSTRSGFAWGLQGKRLNLITEAQEIELTAISTLDSLEGALGGRVAFRFFAHSGGPHTLKVENRCDSQAPPINHPLNIRRPPLALLNLDEFALFKRIDPNSPWVVGSWLGVSPLGEGVPAAVSLDVMYATDGSHPFRNDLPRWNVTDPLQTALSFPFAGELLLGANTASARTRLPLTPQTSGDWNVHIAFTERSHLRSDDLTLNVVEPTDVTDTTRVQLNPKLDDLGTEVARSNTLGAFQIIDPNHLLMRPWAPGEPIPLTIQTFPAAGMFGKLIGRELTVQRLADGVLFSETVNTQVIGAIVFSRLISPVSVQGDNYPDNTDGLIHLMVTPTGGEGDQDLVLGIVPVLRHFTEGGLVSGIPTELRVFNNNVLIQRTPSGGAGVAIADFVDTKNQTYVQQLVRVPGRGLAFSPRELPVTSERVRQAVQDGRLPAGKDKVELFAEGAGSAFRDALGAGISTNEISGFPAGVVVESAVVENERLKITLDTHLTTATGRHEITLTLNDGRAWKGAIQLVKVDLDHPEEHANEHIPLNGDHRQATPQGSNILVAKYQSKFDPEVPNSVRVHLFPSREPGDADFRGLAIDQPLVGFRRERDPNGEPIVSLLELDWLLQDHEFVPIFGNITDQATHDPATDLLYPEEGSDLLPDFVSTAVNAETVAVSVAGNFADAMYFTAFNFVAKPEADDPARVPELDFEQLKDDFRSVADGSRISSAYENFGARTTLADGTPTVAAVSVDTETDGLTKQIELPFSHIRTAEGKIVPLAYHGGILDQYYLAELQGSAYVAPGAFRAPLAQDGRIGSFDGELGMAGCASPTGTGAGQTLRTCFGVELDGVLYDPSLLLADETPNDPNAFFAIPIVNDDITRFNPPSLTGLGLYPDLGGTSGGFFDLETGAAGRTLPGTHFVLSKTPGQSFPGLYAGYLIQGQIEDLKTPYFNNVKDDIVDAALKRDQEVGPLTEERVADGLFTDPRRLMTYGSRNDKKNAITTSLHRSLRFAIETDPPGLDAIVFRAALRVREQPRSVEDSTDLIVTTQSDGWEELQKLGFDTVIEVVKEAIATAVLTALTGGSYLEACGTTIGQGVRDAVLGAAEKFVVDAIGAEVLHTEDYFGVEDTPLYGRRLTPLLSYKAIDPDLLAGSKAPIALNPGSELRKLLKQGSQRRQALEIVEGQAKGLVNFCAVLKKPFSAAADAVKDLVPRESLGGGGAARATAIKILAIEIPMDATSDPEGTNIAWFQLDQAVMITPDESNVHDISQVLALPFDDRADSTTVRELVRTLHSEFDRLQPGSAEYNEGQFNAVSAVLGWIQSPQTHVVKRIPNEAFSGQLGIDTYEDYRVRIASLPSLAVTVTPNGTVSDFKLTTGQTVIPVTASSIVTALRSNQNASARASLRSNGFDMFPIAATIPGPDDP